jgi:COP9 signalosome complex subunit 7
MEGGGVADVLEGYEVLLKTAQGDAAVMTIQKILKDPKVYVFGEILDFPSVQELGKSAKHKQWLDLLKIFAYGTYADYKKDEKTLPALNPPQVTKLRMLTIVTHASRAKSLSYSVLIKELGLQDVRELEDLIIDTVYLGLINGKLDPKRGVVDVEFAMGRDIGPDDVKDMVQTLDSWLVGCDLVMQNLDRNIQQAQKLQESKKKEQEDIDKRMKDIQEVLKLEMEQQQEEAGGLGLLGMGGMPGFNRPAKKKPQMKPSMGGPAGKR